MSRTHHASKDHRRTERAARRRRVDLEAFAPFAAGFREQVRATFTPEQVDRMKRGLPSEPQHMTIGD